MRRRERQQREQRLRRRRRKRLGRRVLENLEPRLLLTAAQNSVNPPDVNADGYSVAGDALAIVNSLESPAPATQPLYLDADGDGAVSHHDVQLVVNHVNSTHVAAPGAASRFAPITCGLISDSSVTGPSPGLLCATGTNNQSGKLAATQGGAAGILVVGTPSDLSDPNDGVLTLREAIEEANGNGPSADVIDLSSLQGTSVVLTQASPLSIASAVQIIGPEDGLTITVGPGISTGIFTVAAGSVATLSNVNILGGNLPTGDGAGIWNAGDLTLTDVNFLDNSTADGDGGAIYNAATGNITLTGSHLSGNTANGDGGAIYNQAGSALTLMDVTMSGNSATGSGGAMAVEATASVAMHNATVSGNDALIDGGGIMNEGDLTLVNATITANTSGSGGVGIENAGTVTLRNTLVAANSGSPDVAGSYLSLGHNLIGDVGAATGFDASIGDQLGGAGTPIIDPVLGPLQENGGAQPTHMPLAHSPAIDAGDNAGVAATDQRGAPRTLDGLDPLDRYDNVATVDIGAVESAALFVNDETDAVDSTPLGDGRVDVDPLTDGDQVTLRGAIQELNALANWYPNANVLGGVLQAWIGFAPGTTRHTLTLAGADENTAVTGDLDVFGDLTVQGRGAEETVVTGGYDPLTPSSVDLGDRILHVLPASSLTLRDISIAGGHAVGASGGGIYNDGGTLDITNAAIGITAADTTGNGADQVGGAIYSRGLLSIQNSSLDANAASSGGGIYIDSGDVTIVDSQLLRNSGATTIHLDSGELLLTGSAVTNPVDGASDAGLSVNDQALATVSSTVIDGHHGYGIVNHGDLTVEQQSIVRNNGANLPAGGGIYNAAAITINDSHIEDNQSTEDGGGIYNTDNATLLMTGGSLSANRSVTGHGGGIYNDNGTVSLDGVRVEGNQSDTLAGAVYNYDVDAHLTITDSTFVRNEAAVSGGAIVNFAGSVAIDGSTFSENMAVNASVNGEGGAITHLGVNQLIAPASSLALVGGTGGTLHQHAQASDTVLLITDTSPFEELPIPFGLRVDDELTVVSSLTHSTDTQPGSVTVWRGQGGTSAASHNAGTPASYVVSPADSFIHTTQTGWFGRFPLPFDVQVSGYFSPTLILPGELENLLGLETMTVIDVDYVNNLVYVDRPSPGWHSPNESVDVLISHDQTTLDVTDATPLARYDLPLPIIVENERMTVTAIDFEAHELSVERGVAGTTAEAHLGFPSVRAVGGSLTVDHSTFSNNAVGMGSHEEQRVDVGGAIYNQVEPFVAITEIDSSTFIDNQADQGASIWTKSTLFSAYTLTGGVEPQYSLYPYGNRVPWTVDPERSLMMRNSVVGEGHAPHDEKVLVRGVAGFVLSDGYNLIESDRVFAVPLNEPAGLYSSQSSFSVADASQLPAAPFVARIGDEKLLVTDVYNNTLWAQRAWDDSVSSAHDDGTALFSEATVKLSVGIDSSQTTLSVTDAGALPQQLPFTVTLTGGNTSEIVEVQSVNGNWLTVQRGATGTTPAAHSAGTLVMIGNPIELTDTGGIDATATTLTISNAASLPPVPFPITVTSDISPLSLTERMLVTAVNANQLTVTRAWDDVAPYAHAEGSIVSLPRWTTIDDPAGLHPSRTTLRTEGGINLPELPFTFRMSHFDGREHRHEEMLVTAIEEDILTVRRAQGGTSALHHPDYATITISADGFWQPGDKHGSRSHLDEQFVTFRDIDTSPLTTQHLDRLENEHAIRVFQSPADLQAWIPDDDYIWANEVVLVREAGGIISGDQQFDVTDASHFPAAPFNIQVSHEVGGVAHHEVMLATEVIGNTLNVLRSNTPIDHPDGAAVTLVAAHQRLDPVLDGLSDNGGSTATHVPRTSSPLIDLGSETRFGGSNTRLINSLHPETTQTLRSSLQGLTSRLIAGVSDSSVNFTIDPVPGLIDLDSTVLVVGDERIQVQTVFEDVDGQGNVTSLSLTVSRGQNATPHNLNAEVLVFPHNGFTGLQTAITLQSAGATTDLAMMVDAMSTSIMVSDAFVLPATPFVAQVDDERMLVTSIDTFSGMLMVDRGVEGTFATSHMMGTPFVTGSAAPVAAESELSSGIDSTTTVIDVSDASSFASLATDFHVLVGDELMVVTYVDTMMSSLHVQRGALGTTAIAHSIGTTVRSLVDLDVDSTDSFPPVPFIGRVGEELMRVLAVDAVANTISVERGAFGSTAGAHPATATFAHGSIVQVADTSLFPEAPFVLRVPDAAGVHEELILVSSLDRSTNVLQLERGAFRSPVVAHDGGAASGALAYYGDVVQLQDAAELPAVPFSANLGSEAVAVTQLDRRHDLVYVDRGTSGTTQSSHHMGMTFVAGIDVPSSLLTLAISDDDSSVTIDPVTLPTPSHFDIQIDDEVMEVQRVVENVNTAGGVDSITLTVVRAVKGTERRQHVEDSSVLILAGDPHTTSGDQRGAGRYTESTGFRRPRRDIGATEAQMFTVNTHADLPDPTLGDGVAETVTPLTVSLRGAVMEANALGYPTTIVLQEGSFDLSQPGASEDAGATGDLDITGDITIVGAGADETSIDAGGLDRVFDVLPGGSLRLIDVFVSGGDTPGSGGGIRVDQGELHLVDTQLSYNTSANGGGVWANLSTVTVAGSTISNNTASALGGAVAALSSSVEVRRATISGNVATSDGGGVFADATSDLVLRSATITGNTADSGGGISGGGISGGGSMDIGNSIVAANTGVSGQPDVDWPVGMAGEFPISSSGTNLIGIDQLVTTLLDEPDGIYAAQTDFAVSDASTLPAAPFAITVSHDIVDGQGNPATVSEDMNVTDVIGNTLFVTRPVGGAAIDHPDGAQVALTGQAWNGITIVDPAGINSTRTSLRLTDQSILPSGVAYNLRLQPSPGTYETVRVTSVRHDHHAGDTTLEVVRGVDGTVAMDHAPTTPVGVSQLGFNAPGDLFGVSGAILDPQLGALQRLHGATMTHEPLLGSPAIDAGSDVPFQGATTTLSKALPIGSSTAWVTHATELPAAPFEIRIGTEAMTVVEVSGRQLTVERASRASTEDVHLKGDTVEVLSDQRGRGRWFGIDATPVDIGAHESLPDVTLEALNPNQMQAISGAVRYDLRVTRTGNLDGTSTVDYAVTVEPPPSATLPAGPSDFLDSQGLPFPHGTVTLGPGVPQQDFWIDVAGSDLSGPDYGFNVYVAPTLTAVPQAASQGGGAEGSAAPSLYVPLVVASNGSGNSRTPAVPAHTIPSCAVLQPMGQDSIPPGTIVESSSHVEGAHHTIVPPWLNLGSVHDPAEPVAASTGNTVDTMYAIYEEHAVVLSVTSPPNIGGYDTTCHPQATIVNQTPLPTIINKDDRVKFGDIEVDHNDANGITFNPVAMMNVPSGVNLTDNPNLEFQFTFYEDDGTTAVGTIGRFGTLTDNHDSTLTYVPDAGLKGNAPRTGVKERLSADMIHGEPVRFSGLDIVKIEATLDGHVVGTAELEILVRNDLPVLRGHHLHDPHDRFETLASGGASKRYFELDGYVFAEPNETYRVDLRTVFTDPDGRDDLQDLEIVELQTVLGLSTSDTQLTVSNGNGDMTIAKTGQSAVQISHDVTSPGSNIVEFDLLVTDGQYEAPEAPAQIPTKRHTFKVRLRVRLGESEKLSPWVTKVTQGTPDFRVSIPSQQTVNSELVGGVDVDLARGTLRRYHDVTFDASNGASELAIPGLIYDSAMVERRPVINVLVEGTVATPQVGFKWYGRNGTATSPDLGITAVPGGHLITIRPDDSPSSTGVYEWDLTVYDASGTIKLRGETPVVVADGPHDFFGNGWRLAGVPTLHLDKRTEYPQDPTNDRRILSFPGETPRVFADWVANGVYPSLQLGSTADLTDGYADTRQFGTLRQYSTDGFVYDDGFGKEYYFDSTGNVLRIEQPGIDMSPAAARRVLRFERNGGGGLTKVIATDGGETLVNADHFIMSVGGMTRRVDFTVDSGGWLTSISQPHDGSTAPRGSREFRYVGGQLTEDFWLQPKLDSNGVQEVDTNGNPKFDTVRYTQFDYDANQLLKQVQQGDGNGAAQHTIVHNITSAATAGLAGTGLVAEVKVAPGYEKLDAQQDVVSNSGDLISRYTYDFSSNLTSREDLFAGTSLSTQSWTYDHIGSVSTAIDALGRETEFRYDYEQLACSGETDCLTENDSVNSLHTHSVYDPIDDYRGNVVSIITGAGITRHEYETDDEHALGYLTKTIANVGDSTPVVTLYKRLKDGRLTERRTIRGLPDDLTISLPLSPIFPLLPVITIPVPVLPGTEDYVEKWAYESAGTGPLKTHTDARGLETHHSYANSLLETLDSSGSSGHQTRTTQTYNGLGQLERRQTRAGGSGVVEQVTETFGRSLDGLVTNFASQLTTTNATLPPVPPPPAEVDRHYTFTVDGVTTSVTTAYGNSPSQAARTTSVYDRAGLLTETVTAQGESYRSLYSGQQESIEQRTVFSYYKDGTPSTVQRSDGVTENSYVNPTQLTRWSVMNGVSAGEHENTSQQFQLRENEKAATRTITDAAGRVLTESNLLTGAATTFTYDDARHDLPTGTSTPVNIGAIGTLTLADAVHTVTTAARYDGFGSPVFNRQAALSGTIRQYDVLGYAVREESLDDHGPAFSYLTNGAGDVISRTETRTTIQTPGAPPAVSVDNFTTTFEYDKRGRVTKVTDPLSSEPGVSPATVSYQQVNRELQVTATSREGLVTLNHYDPHGKLVLSQNAFGATTEFDYDRAGNLIEQTFTPASGDTIPARRTTFEYDALGRLRATVYHDTDLSDGDSSFFTAVDYFLPGDANADGWDIVSYDAMAGSDPSTYTASDIKERGTRTRVDSLGNPYYIQQPDPTPGGADDTPTTLITYSFDKDKLVSAVTTRLSVFGNATATNVGVSDSFRRVNRVVSNTRGQTLLTSQRTSDLDEDDAGAAPEFTGDGFVTRSRNEYNLNTGVIGSSEDGLGNITSYDQYRFTTLVGGVTKPNGEVTTFEFDSAGNRTHLSYDSGHGGTNDVTWEYDALGRTISETTLLDALDANGLPDPAQPALPLARTWFYKGVDLIYTDRDGRVVDTTFDPGLRLRAEVATYNGLMYSSIESLHSDGSVEWVDERIEESTDLLHHTTMDSFYDEFGRGKESVFDLEFHDAQSTPATTYQLQSKLRADEFQPGGGRKEFSLHLDSVPTNGTDDFQQIFANTYTEDWLGRTTKIEQAIETAAGALWSNGQAGIDKDVDFSYLADGNRQQVNRNVFETATTDYTYHADGRPEDITHRTSQGFNLATYDLQYDDAERLSSRHVQQYDGVSTLLFDSDRVFTYDDDGQISNVAETITDPVTSNQTTTNTAYPNGQSSDSLHWTVGRANRLYEDDNYIYEYDLEGRLVEKRATGSAQPARVEYRWDHRGRLLKVEDFDATTGGTLQQTVRYAYDPLGRQVAREVKDAAGAITSATGFINDGLNPIAEVDLTATKVERTYLLGPGVNEVLSIDEPSAAGTFTIWTFADPLGTTRTLATHDLGSSDWKVVHRAFSEFGQQEPLDDTSTLIGDTTFAALTESPALFAGHQFDPDTGLIYMKARWYDPTTGRFTIEDPLGFAAGDENLYRYVGNKSTNAIDPDGLDDLFVNKHGNAFWEISSWSMFFNKQRSVRAYIGDVKDGVVHLRPNWRYYPYDEGSIREHYADSTGVVSKKALRRAIRDARSFDGTGGSDRGKIVSKALKQASSDVADKIRAFVGRPGVAYGYPYDKVGTSIAPTGYTPPGIKVVLKELVWRPLPDQVAASRANVILPNAGLREIPSLLSLPLRAPRAGSLDSEPSLIEESPLDLNTPYSRKSNAQHNGRVAPALNGVPLHPKAPQSIEFRANLQHERGDARADVLNKITTVGSNEFERLRVAKCVGVRCGDRYYFRFLVFNPESGDYDRPISFSSRPTGDPLLQTFGGERILREWLGMDPSEGLEVTPSYR